MTKRSDDQKNFFWDFEQVNRSVRRQGRGNTFRLIAIAMFTVFAMLVFAYRLEIQQNQLRAQQYEIRQTQYNTCLTANLILQRFNAQQAALAATERQQTLDPTLAQKRIDAYMSGIVKPLFTCKQ